MEGKRRRWVVQQERKRERGGEREAWEREREREEEKKKLAYIHTAPTTLWGTKLSTTQKMGVCGWRRIEWIGCLCGWVSGCWTSLKIRGKGCCFCVTLGEKDCLVYVQFWAKKIVLLLGNFGQKDCFVFVQFWGKDCCFVKKAWWGEEEEEEERGWWWVVVVFVGLCYLFVLFCGVGLFVLWVAVAVQGSSSWQQGMSGFMATWKPYWTLGRGSMTAGDNLLGRKIASKLPSTL